MIQFKTTVNIFCALCGNRKYHTIDQPIHSKVAKIEIDTTEELTGWLVTEKDCICPSCVTLAARSAAGLK